MSGFVTTHHGWEFHGVRGGLPGCGIPDSRLSGYQNNPAEGAGSKPARGSHSLFEGARAFPPPRRRGFTFTVSWSGRSRFWTTTTAAVVFFPRLPDSWKLLVSSCYSSLVSPHLGLFEGGRFPRTGKLPRRRQCAFMGAERLIARTKFTGRLERFPRSVGLECASNTGKTPAVFLVTAARPAGR